MFVKRKVSRPTRDRLPDADEPIAQPSDDGLTEVVEDSPLTVAAKLKLKHSKKSKLKSRLSFGDDTNENVNAYKNSSRAF
jgi:hypothetical protein